MDIHLFRKVILANELGNNPALAYKFSDPDGVGRGKSGYSFGVCQFDIANNPTAILCLRSCDFTTDQIDGLRRQTIDPRPLEQKLLDAQDVVDRYDEQQLHECMEHPLNICAASGIRLRYPNTLYHLADYHNQFYFSKNGKMHTFLKTLGRAVLPSDILHLKFNTKWGRINPGDVHRRFSNIERLLKVVA